MKKPSPRGAAGASFVFVCVFLFSSSSVLVDGSALRGSSEVRLILSVILHVGVCVCAREGERDGGGLWCVACTSMTRVHSLEARESGIA